MFTISSVYLLYAVKKDEAIYTFHNDVVAEPDSSRILAILVY